jgi:hypothetical protein
MPNSRRGLVLLLIAVLMIGGATWLTWQFEQQANGLRADADRLSRQYSALEVTIADLRTAQAGYVAIGQGSDFWMQRVDELTLQLEQLLGERRRVAAAGADAPLESALSLVEALRTSDARARRYVGNDQRLMASDVVYVESLDILNRINTEVTTGREVDMSASATAAFTVRRNQAAAAAGLALILLILLIMAARSANTEATDAAGVSVAPAPDMPAPASLPAPSPVMPAAVPVNLNATADVCVDIARLLDGRDLPGILTRAAGALQARGLVLWVINQSADSLRPTLAHGYSERTMQKLGTLAVSADNVTALACRSLQPQSVPGALAVPLIGTNGCVGVLAAEVSDSDVTTLPVARLIAAQLASVITPLPAADAATDSPAESAAAGQ